MCKIGRLFPSFLVRIKLQKEISELKVGSQSRPAKIAAGAEQKDLETEISIREQQLKSIEEDQALIDEYYGGTSSSTADSVKLLRDYDSLEALAKNFGGRSFNLDNPAERLTFKVYLLSSIRPQALKVLEELAVHYHDKFARPLPISSLVRPEQYQHALRRVNRYAAVIDTPPHSTGLAFDIDYRYMSVAEQNFLMSDLARMKDEGRIEVLRERGANFHVFAFIDGQRPNDELIIASLNEVGPSTKNPNEGSDQKAVRRETKTRTTRNVRATNKANRTASKTRAKRHS